MGNVLTHCATNLDEWRQYSVDNGARYRKQDAALLSAGRKKTALLAERQDDKAIIRQLQVEVSKLRVSSQVQDNEFKAALAEVSNFKSLYKQASEARDAILSAAEEHGVRVTNAAVLQKVLHKKETDAAWLDDFMDTLIVPRAGAKK